MGLNYAIDSDSNAYIYSGNYRGLLEYNGAYWTLHRMPYESSVNSILIGRDGRIYVGSYEEFGYFERDVFGTLNYHSLSQFVNSVGESIHTLFEWNDCICFSSDLSCFIYDGEKLTVRNYPFPVRLIRNVHDKIYVFSPETGIELWENDNFSNIIAGARFQNAEIVSILPFDGKLLLFSDNKGLFLFDGTNCEKWESRINEEIRELTINKAGVLNESEFLLGTNNNGLYSFDKKGNINWTISMSNGLQNNTINDLKADSRGNISVALNDGISYIEKGSDVRFIYPKNDKGTILAALFHDGYFYLATNQGLFCNKTENIDSEFQLIPELKGPVSYLNIFDNQLICCHANGTYSIQKDKAKLLSNVRKAAIIQKVTVHQQEILIQSAYSTLTVYRKNKAGEWTFSNSIPDFLHPIRKIESDVHGNIWLAHAHKGLFRVRLNRSLTETEQIEHFPLNNDAKENKVHLFKLKGRVVFGNNTDYFTFDDINNTIVSYRADFKKIPDIREVIGIDDDNYWCIARKGICRFHCNGNEVSVERFIPFSYFANDLPDYHRNMTLSDGQIVFCLNNRIALIKNEETADTNPLPAQIHITSVQVFSEQDTLSIPLRPAEKPEWSRDYNNIAFGTSIDNRPAAGIECIYELDGSDYKPSLSDRTLTKEYTRLRHGNYTFRAIVRDFSGKELSRISYDFRIKPPFYWSFYAVIIYSLLFICLIFASYFLLRWKIKRSRLKITLEQEQWRLKENELKNSNLQTELTFKSKEMANAAFMLISKNNILSEVKSELSAQKEELGARYPEKYYDRIVRIIDSGINLEDSWEVFRANFDMIHKNFFRNLKKTYPQLTSNDLKVCALLRLNLSTKDMAQFLGNTVRGVDSARYRLRKKLKLPGETDIVEFLIRFEGHENK
jgi:outer membrane protein assembly factor BamB/DNA-binding CsgD family transcriptional regulator